MHPAFSMSVKIRFILLSILFLALLGCGETPPQSSDLIGTWEIENKETPGTLALRPDATFTADTSAGKLSGTWKIDNDHLVGTVDESTISNISMGYSWDSEISHFSSDKLTLKNKSGETDNYRRIK